MVTDEAKLFKDKAIVLVLICLTFGWTTMAFGQGDWVEVDELAFPKAGSHLDDPPERPCAADFVVAEFPYSNTADLDDAGNDCPFLPGQEHVYEIHILQEGLYTFSLCNSPSSINSYIYLSTRCCGGEVIASNNNSCPIYGRSVISCKRLNAGVYYLDVEPRSAGGEDVYTLEIFTCEDPCPLVYPTDTTFVDEDSIFTWIQCTDENDTSPLYDGPWYDPDMPAGRDPYNGFEHYSWYNQDYGWKHIFPDYDSPDGVCIQSVKVSICAWDVDQQDCSIQHPGEPEECELDRLYGDGTLLYPEYLHGNNDVWSVTMFDIPPSTLLDNGELDMFIDIDVWNNRRYWATTLNYSILEVIYRPGHVCNNPPFTPEGYGWPACINDNDSLCVTITGPTPADPDMDDVSYTYRWFVRNDYTEEGFVDDENAPPHYIDHDGACIPASDSDVGDEWRAEIWAVDTYGTQSLYSLVISFPEIVTDCGGIDNPVVGWDYGDLDSTAYTTQNNLRGGPANAIRLFNLAWLGEICTDDQPEPRVIDQDVDDGVVFVDHIWPGCDEICVDITISTGPEYAGQSLFVSAWKDGNLNHSFNDVLCGGTAPECILPSEEVAGLGPNESVVRRYCFTDPALPMGGHQVLRFRLTYDSIGCDGYIGVDSILGETEDYVMDFPLAVELSNAAVNPGIEQITLEWETASEQDNDRFEIERRVGETLWQTIGSSPGAGTSASSHSYTYVDTYVTAGVQYSYRLISVDIGGVREIVYETDSPVSPVKAEIVSYRLYANWPNPFNPNTTIVYDVKEYGHVQLRIFDVLGREAAVLVNESQEAGQHKITFDASPLPSGIYFYRLKAGEFTDTKKMIFMK